MNTTEKGHILEDISFSYSYFFVFFNYPRTDRHLIKKIIDRVLHKYKFMT